MAKSRIPETVVRFYGKGEYALDLLAKKRVAFIHISQMNDPFDPYLFFETDFGEKYDLLLDYVSKRHPDDLAGFKAVCPVEHWEESLQKIVSYMKCMEDSTFMLSTSAPLDNCLPRDNLYMWGHYGNGHRGVAVEFNTKDLSAFALDKKQTISESENGWLKVSYDNKLKPIDRRAIYEFYMMADDAARLRSNLINYFNAFLMTKSTVWRSENEWRLLWRNDETDLKYHYADIGDGAIRAVYIGLRSSDALKNEVVSIASKNFPNAHIFKAKKLFGAFGLEFARVQIAG